MLARAIETTDVRPVPFQRWLDVGRPWELLEANERKLAEIERNVCGDVSEGAEVLGDVVVESEAVIRAGAVVEGPVFIGTGAEIGPNAYLKGATALGPGATVGHAVEVKNSLLMRGAYASHLSYVGDSILGRSVNLGAGTVIGNLRHDDSPVALSVRRERVSTGRRKFGVVLGDGVKTGVGTCLNAGVTLSTETWTDPGEIVTRDR